MAAYDIAILGGGPGGYVAALHAAVKGAKVALVERDRVGGICVTVGCIPSKALLDSSHAYWLATHGEEHGIHVEGARFELAAAVARKDRVVAQLVSGVEVLLKGRKADLIKGEGTLISPTQLRVGQETIDAKAVIVATGSKVGMPPIKGVNPSTAVIAVRPLLINSSKKRVGFLKRTAVRALPIEMVAPIANVPSRRSSAIKFAPSSTTAITPPGALFLFA